MNELDSFGKWFNWKLAITVGRNATQKVYGK